MEEISSTKLFKVIGKNIKYYRKLYNLKIGKMTQEDLAEIVDVSTALIGGLESDKINQGVSVFNLWKISNALQISIDKLFDNSECKNEAVKNFTLLIAEKYRRKMTTAGHSHGSFHTGASNIDYFLYKLHKNILNHLP